MINGSGLTTDQQLKPEIDQQLITIIVPTRNEADNISPLMQRVAKAATDLQVEVLFVDDSQDDTASAIRSIQAQYPFPIHLIVRPAEARNGLSGAVVDGLRAAHGEWICVIDADLQHPPETILRMWEKAQKSGADMVVGSRRGDLAGPFGLTRLRSLTSKTLTVLARMLFPRLLRNVSDPLTGLFLVRRSRIDVDSLRPDGFKILLEILVRCPDLHVTEIHFDFAPRHGGQSKADFREGIRFFRHVVRLRLTVNPHLVRFLLTLLLGFLGNGLLLWAITEKSSLSYWLSGLISAEILALWVVLIFDHWVFRERNKQRTLGSSAKHFLLAQIVLFLIYLPIFFVLVSWLSFSYWLANFIAIGMMGLALYGVSEQWVLTKGGMAWQQRSYYYRIHQFLTIESQVALADLQYFAVNTPDGEIDIQIRLDRQGTPSELPGGLSYNERLGRFGFGITVIPGDFLQIIVSPLLERSPGFLFTNIVEPTIRWRLVTKGCALVKSAGVTSGKSAVLIHGAHDLGQMMGILCRQYGYQFMADDLSIVDKVGTVYSYPKPVTINQNMMLESQRPTIFRDRFFFGAQRLLYTRLARRIGLWLSNRNLPAATLNTYLQWLVPQPKAMLDEVYSGLDYGESAPCALIVNIVRSEKAMSEDPDQSMSRALQLDRDSTGFPPHPLLANGLRFDHQKDLLDEERAIIQNLVKSSILYWPESGGNMSWASLAKDIFDNDLDRDTLCSQEKRDDHANDDKERSES